ncbi:hypothetical protein REPUB_Repub04eG0091900 [Reevesia pubescens]
MSYVNQRETKMVLSQISLTFCLIGLALCSEYSHSFVIWADNSGAVPYITSGPVAHSDSGAVPYINSGPVAHSDSGAPSRILAESPTHSQDSSPQGFINVHNAARAEVGVGRMTWDDVVAAYAANYAKERMSDCNLVHSGGPYGENLAWSSADFSGTDAVKMWINEKSNYDLKSNTCASGRICGHYTQVIWANSTRLGCAKARCSDGGTFIVCNYDPPGNYIGKRPTSWNQSIFRPLAPSPDLSIVAESPTHSQDSSPQGFINVHNAARAEVGVGHMIWDDVVAAYAANYAKERMSDCNLVHSGGPYGENLAWSSADLSGTDAVKMWIDEKSNYDLKSNTCASGRICGHYTQVIWANSIRLGCAKARCSNGGTFIVCNYDPPGNYVGQRPTSWNQSIFRPLAPSPDSIPHFFTLKDKKKDMKGLVVGLIVGACALIFGLGFIWFISRRKGNKLDDHISDVFFGGEFQSGMAPRKFSLVELAKVTSNFKGEKLGKGGFGAVYKGYLRDLDSYVAVKRISEASKQGIKEYASEVKIISRLRHKNLVKLIGWCHEKGELILVTSSWLMAA